MDNVDRLLDEFPVDKLIKSIEELTGMGWGGFVFTLVLTAAVVVLKIWWDRNKKKIRQGRTEYERNQERANTGKENESIEAGAADGERIVDGARSVPLGSEEFGDTRVDIQVPKPKRPVNPDGE